MPFQNSSYSSQYIEILKVVRWLKYYEHSCLYVGIKLGKLGVPLQQTLGLN